MDDETLRRLVRPQTDRVPADREQCPSPEVLQQVATTPTGAASQLAVLEHVATCAPCRHDFNLLRTANAAAPMPAQSPALTRWIPALAAAAVIAVVSLVSTRSVDEVVRGATNGRPTVQLLAPTRAATGVQLQWHAVAQAVIYRVEVTDHEGNLAFSAETVDTVALAPELFDASRLRWSVEARLLDGSVLTSPLDSLRAPP
jgi:hypothetical protein